MQLPGLQAAARHGVCILMRGLPHASLPTGAMRALAVAAAAALLLACGAAAQQPPPCATIEHCDDCAADRAVCTACSAGFTGVDGDALWCALCRG